jgi:hypothetical protein
MLATLDAASPRASVDRTALVLAGLFFIVVSIASGYFGYRVGYDTGRMDGQIEGFDEAIDLTFPLWKGNP